MNRATFCKIAATVFGFIALAQASRLALNLPVQVGAVAIPMWVSWCGALVAGALSVLGFRARP